MMEVGFVDDPNLAILTRVARALGELRDSLVFVGGCATGLLLTASRAQWIRVTQDVDLVAQVASAIEYHKLEKAFATRGFKHDVSAEAPICRWEYDGVKIDLMPTERGILGFHNRWYPYAVKTAASVILPGNIVIRLIAAPVFIATKLEAFHGRGNNDYLASHDLEDILTIVDGRAELLDEAIQHEDELRHYLSEQFTSLLANSNFVQALPGHLPSDTASQARLTELLRRLNRLANLMSHS